MGFEGADLSLIEFLSTFKTGDLPSHERSKPLTIDECEVFPPRADFIPVLPSHAFGDLMNVVQVVRHPSRQ